METINKIAFIIFCALSFIVVFSVSTIASLVIAMNNNRNTIAVEWSETAGREYRNLRYGNEDGCEYDLYLPKTNSSNKQALVLYIHGGSFTSGDKSEGEPWCKYYASQGYVAATANYPLHSDGSPSDINKMNVCIKDCVDSITATCNRLGYHLTEMAVTGASAGGCLAMLYAYSMADHSALPVRFVFQQSAPTSFHPELWGITDDSLIIEFASMMSGIAITDSMIQQGAHTTLLDNISPASRITPSSPPTICAYGLNDNIVPKNQKHILFDSLKAKHIPCIYIEFPHSGHALANDPDSMAVYVKNADMFCNKYFQNKTPSVTAGP